jgi:hypothetical protein
MLASKYYQSTAKAAGMKYKEVLKSDEFKKYQ